MQKWIILFIIGMCCLQAQQTLTFSGIADLRAANGFKGKALDIARYRAIRKAAEYAGIEVQAETSVKNFAVEYSTIRTRAKANVINIREIYADWDRGDQSRVLVILQASVIKSKVPVPKKPQNPTHPKAPAPSKPVPTSHKFIVAMVQVAGQATVTYFSDGNCSKARRGKEGKLSSASPPVSYTLPRGYTPHHIAGMASTDGKRIAIYFSDGKYIRISQKKDRKLDSGALASYSLPKGYKPQHIVGMAQTEGQRIVTYFKDGKYIRSRKGKDGNLAAGAIPKPYMLPEGYKPHHIVAITKIEGQRIATYFSDGKYIRARRGKEAQLSSESGPRPYRLPHGYSAK